MLTDHGGVTQTAFVAPNPQYCQLTVLICSLFKILFGIRGDPASNGCSSAHLTRHSIWRPPKATMGPRNGERSSSTDVPKLSNYEQFFFLSPEAARNIPQYHYKGQDLSLLYHYVLSPLASFCVDHLTPRRIAPNSITLIGLAFMVASYSLLWYHVPTLEPSDETDHHRWIFLFNAIAMLLYQTLDNMDGKQARRTHSSSPLGLLFDHGCDAVNSVFGSTNWIIAMKLHPKHDAWLCWTILFGPYALFYVGTWEEYYTGELIMPIVNGPNEGLLGGAMMSLASFVYGHQFWQQHSCWTYLRPILSLFVPSYLYDRKLRNADLLVFASSVGFVQEVSLKIVCVARRRGWTALLDLAPFLTLLVCSLIVAWVDLSLWLELPRTMLHLCAILFVEMTTALMLAHISHQRFRPFRWTLLPLILLTMAVVIGHGEESRYFWVMYMTGAGVFLLMKSVIIIHEICVILNIWCFDITTPRQRHYAHTNGQNKLD